MRGTIKTLTAVLAVTVALVAPPVRVQAQTSRPVGPRMLQRGADPRVLWYDRATGRLHDGRVVLTARFPGQVEMVARVHGGYLLANRTATDRLVLRRVDPTGRAHAVFEANDWVPGLVSPDGRRVVVHGTTSHPRVLVVRVADGQVLRDRRFGTPLVRVVAFGDHGWLLVGLFRRTVWWLPGGRLAPFTDAPATGAHLAGRRVALAAPEGTLQRVAGIPVGTGPAWSSTTELIGAFAPGGRRVLTTTADPRSRFNHVGYRQVSVRDARTGTLLRTVTGTFGKDEPVRWETRRDFLVLAEVPHPSGASPVRMAWVRCWVDASVPCRRASPLFSLDLDRPPYGVVPWLLATEPGVAQDTLDTGYE